ncbi:MAG: hypothetical protein IKB70_00390 [Bacilli bacterium]|nr:hypothetical protein [Bacilli bacterium]
MGKLKEKLLEKLREEKLKLEVKKRRFEVWEKEICEKDEEGYATVEDIKKENMFWRKKRRLEERISAIDDKIHSLRKNILTIIKEAF